MTLPRVFFLVRIILLTGTFVPVFAATNGGEIYRQKCADCHGAQGQGVESEYADALYGDWGLPKLTRYIAKNMPEDDPESLTPGEADAVARFVYDAFYSRAAQARNHPARIEIARLTNQQYAIAIADLVTRLTPARSEPRPETATDDAVQHGLHAFYYSVAQRGRFDGSKIVFAGVDPVLDFTFAEGNSAGAHVGNFEQFSMQWRGAVLADETGDYEFVVRTPNSVRVWINAEHSTNAAALDVMVSRPDDPDHRATVRLLGGRWYPLAIDYWALPGKAGAPAPSLALCWKPPHGSERIIPARNLSPAKTPSTFVIGTRFPADDSSRGYERSGAVSKAWDEATTNAAFEVANHAVKNIDRLAGTRPDDPERARKVAAWTERFVATAFRRPLTADEQQRYIATRFADGADVDVALKRTVLLALKSPHFLYVELPLPAQSSSAAKQAETPAPPPPTMAQIAARLSFGLWDSLPDETLERAAAAARLGSRVDVVAQATRMLGDTRARAKLREFFHHWLQVRFVENMAKDPATYPEFNAGMIDDLRTSLNLFLDDVAWSERADFRELLRADQLFVNERLAKFYGLELPPPPVGKARLPGEFVRVAASGTERSGVLTHPYLLAAFSYKKTSSPIHRGVFLTRSVAGRSLKSPPVAVAFNETEFSADMSMREKVAQLTRSENCQGCHAIINPLGFSLEWFDAAGRFRREDMGRPIDAVSEYLTDENRTVRFARPRDVAEFALASEPANLAFIEQLFHHVVKQPVMAFGPEALPRLRESFIASSYNLQKLLVEIVTLSALRGVEPAVAVQPPRKDRP